MLEFVLGILLISTPDVDEPLYLFFLLPLCIASLWFYVGSSCIMAFLICTSASKTVRSRIFLSSSFIMLWKFLFSVPFIACLCNQNCDLTWPLPSVPLCIDWSLYYNLCLCFFFPSPDSAYCGWNGLISTMLSTVYYSFPHKLTELLRGQEASLVVNEV